MYGGPVYAAARYTWHVCACLLVRLPTAQVNMGTLDTSPMAVLVFPIEDKYGTFRHGSGGRAPPSPPHGTPDGVTATRF